MVKRLELRLMFCLLTRWLKGPLCAKLAITGYPGFLGLIWRASAFRCLASGSEDLYQSNHLQYFIVILRKKLNVAQTTQYAQSWSKKNMSNAWLQDGLSVHCNPNFITVFTKSKFNKLQYQVLRSLMSSATKSKPYHSIVKTAMHRNNDTGI